MLAHAFTTSQPVTRRDAIVFPYAIASARDPVGPWVHEMGHLFGLPDEYVSSGLCPGEGVGMWSLMATGSNLGDGESPSGLDAYCRQLLGIPAESRRKGSGSTRRRRVRARLRSRRGGGTAVLSDRAADDRGGGRDPPGHAGVRGERSGGRQPQLHATAGGGPGRALHHGGSLHRVPRRRHRRRTCATPTIGPPGSLSTSCSTRCACATANDARAPVGARAVAPGRERRRAAAHRAHRAQPAPGRGGRGTALVTALSPAARTTWSGRGQPAGHDRPPEGRVVDTSWALEPGVRRPRRSAAGRRELEIQLRARPRWVCTSMDTVTVVAGSFGLAAGRLDLFTSQRLDTYGADPWTRDGYGVARRSAAAARQRGAPEPVLHGAGSGDGALDHAWNLAALSPDVALDAAQVRVIRQTGPAVDIEPPMGWGYTVERGTGNAMGGSRRSPAGGDRVHVFDLSAWAGETVRLSLRVAGDVDTRGEHLARVRGERGERAGGRLARCDLLDSARGRPHRGGDLERRRRVDLALPRGPAWGTPVTRYTAETRCLHDPRRS